MAKLFVTSGLEFREIEMLAVVTIGRTADSTLALEDPAIAREHAEIHRMPNGRFVLRDLSTLNGTFIRGERVIGDRMLVDGDVIELGQARLRFMDDRGDTAETPAVHVDEAPGTRELGGEALRRLLADPGDTKQLLETLCDLIDASCVELYQQSRDGTLLPEGRVRRAHDMSHGPSSTMRSKVFAEVMASRTPVLRSHLDAPEPDSYELMNRIESTLVVPVVADGAAIGVLYAHQTPRSLEEGPKVVPFTASDLDLCLGVAKVAALSAVNKMRSREQFREHATLATLDMLLPPSLAFEARRGALDPMVLKAFSKTYLLDDMRTNAPRPGIPPESDTLRSASQAAAALPPIDRIALAGRLLQSAAASDLSGVIEILDRAFPPGPPMTIDELTAELEKLKRGE